MNKNNKKAIKHYLCGAISAFSVVAAYKAYKTLKNKKKNAVDTSNNDGHYYGTSSNTLHTSKFDRSTLNTPNEFELGESGKGKAFRMDHEERILQPKHITYNKEYIEDRKALQAPSGFIISSSYKKEKCFFKKEVNNVLRNTDDKIVIINNTCSAVGIIPQCEAEYTVDYIDVTHKILDKARYDNIKCIGSPLTEYIGTPLTERVTVFNANNDVSLIELLIYTFIQASITAGAEQQHIWLFIPDSIFSVLSVELSKIMMRSRMAGVIVTAAVNDDDVILHENIRNMVFSREYIAFTEDIEKYNETCHCDLSKYIGTSCYQFDMDETESEVKY